MTTFRCPSCGRVLVVQSGELAGGFEELRGYPAEWGNYREVSTPVAPAAFSELRRETPVRPPTIEADVLVPAAQAGLSGLAATIGATLGAVVWSWPWYIPVAVGGGAMCLTWAGLLLANRGLLRTVERVVHRDLDGDGQVGEPRSEPEPRPVTEITVTVPKQGAASVYFLKTDVDHGVLRSFCKAAVGGATLAVGSWAGGGKPFTRQQYDGLMAELTRAGLVEDLGGNKGRTLTRAGRHVLARIADGASE